MEDRGGERRSRCDGEATVTEEEEKKRRMVVEAPSPWSSQLLAACQVEEPGEPLWVPLLRAAGRQQLSHLS